MTDFGRTGMDELDFDTRGLQAPLNPLWPKREPAIRGRGK